MKILFLPLYRIEFPSSRYRLFQFLQPLEAQGISCTVLQAPNQSNWHRLLYLPKLLHLARRHDLIFIQKRTLPQWLLKRLGKPIVYDLDDAIYLRAQNAAAVHTMLQRANLVLAGNDELATYARAYNPQVVVLPTVVDTAHYQPKPPIQPATSKVVIGWIGTNPNRGDLALIRPVLDWLGKDHGDRVTLRIVSDQPLALQTAVNTEFVPWSLEQSLAELQKFDIGLMPLADSPWNRGKCGLKLIEYMAVGAASVASPVGVNGAIIEHGKSGFLAQSLEEWQQYLGQLIADRTLATKMGAAARARVLAHYSVDAVLPALVTNLKAIYRQSVASDSYTQTI